MSKRFLTIFVFCGLTAFVAAPCFGAAQALSGSGTVTDTTGGSGTTLAFSLSPNVSLSYNATNAEFEIAGVNTKGTMEYGVYSTSPAVYQQAKTPADGVIAVTTLTTTDGSTVSGWNQMGGS